MKSLEAVLKKREELRKQLEIQKKSKNQFSITEWSNFSDEEKKTYSRIMHDINMLTIQIDALTYVINYDSEIMDIKQNQGGWN
ncbi:hypothetical protein PQE68_gp056 [Bacillus phage vB_BanS_Sophrita]|uniref:Uncharacterized protein n=1 Tax=Bacillus phage vB_BanS_Sophrita TaxID=2894790 RepID=A0AAE8YU54_9CAUD|nr:hypothetical protein PQE68_gp056 [Bacillus phage vB_BanS_Sophrita]UGO50647.1 hypothetical protein SOPHRITA_56 [Bacillus phage vB_BanS_Sophrita]